MTLAVTLLLAHLLGDYTFQTSWIVRGKVAHKLRSPHIWVHIAIHGILVQLLVQVWWITAVTLVTHAAIDVLKVVKQNPERPRFWFLLDQVLHVMVIAGIVVWSEGLGWADFSSWFEENLILITAVIFLTKPCAYLVGVTIECWQPKGAQDIAESTNDAGAMIGILERLFVFAFVLLGHWEGIGFLLVAKAIFRVARSRGDSGNQSSKYILVGTLLSFGVAFFTGLLVLWIS